MAASFVSKFSRVGRSLLGGLSNNISSVAASSTSPELTSSSNALYQMLENLSYRLFGYVLPCDSCLFLMEEPSSWLSILHQQHRTFIQMRTVLKVADNSGAKKVMCIQALKGRKGARLGDTIVASVKEAMPNGKVKKGKVVYGVVVRAAMQKGRCDGSEVKFDDNAVVLVDKQGQPIGTRVFGPVPHELRRKKHVKILTLAEHIA
ncbi:unnamed protein product [Linum tenue]|uniref:Ribosomal protein L14 n=1 Tax=Linum tenue TaxID=586396 RepID=A0AAV0GW16_9ROSI|nr:unnamed protein product [Linum tenue]CAI0377171.1 unnamed protein product [Linum tenue]CAI0377191.1 unnamed protein product [Linum tenue]